MEKAKPHYDLKTMKKLFGQASTRIITVTAHKGAASMGYMDVKAIRSVIDRLSSEHFYKSMTSYENHRIWQDVYHFMDEDGRALYIKLQLSPDGTKTVLIQMKEDEGRWGKR